MNNLDEKEPGGRINGEMARRIALWSFAVVLLVFSLVPVLHFLRGHSMKDYIVWYDAGQQVLRGGEVYPGPWQKFPFMYPPPCALFLAPLSALGKVGLISVLVLVNAAAWIGSIFFSTYLATGKRGRHHLLLYLVPNVIVGAYVWGNFLLGQPSLLLLALMLGAFLALWQRHQVLAGVLIALAAAIKAFPVVALIYLLYRRYWIASAALILTLVFLLIVAPLPFRGYVLAKQDLQRWSNGMLFKYDETGIGQRTGRSYSWRNQSIWGVSNRLLRHVEYDPSYAPHTPVYANFADLSFKAVNGIILTAALLLGLIYVGVMPARAQRTRETDSIEFALLLLLILIFTPMSFGYLFGWLLYPLTVVLQRLLIRPRGGLLIWAALAVFLLSLSIPLEVPAQTYANTLLATFLLFVGLAFELFRLKRGTSGRRLGEFPLRADLSGSHFESSVTSVSRDL